MPGDFLVADNLAEPALELVGAALPTRLAGTHTERIIWLDTHDWRLFRAGLQLVQHRTARESRLVLSGLDGAEESRAAVGPDVVTVATLPEGPIQDRVRALVDIRELLPKAVLRGPTSMLAVLDDQTKTVARIAVQGPLTLDRGEGTLGVRVRVETMRGYTKEAQQATERLAATAGLQPANSSLLEAASAALGLEPGRHRSKPELTLYPAMPAREAFASTFRQLLEIVHDNLDGTLRQVDTEFLHDLRVAVRRSRSVLKVAANVIDEDVLAHHTRGLKWLADATSLSRDLDVYLLGFDERIGHGGMAGLDPAELEPFRLLLIEHTEKAHATLNQVLRSQRCKNLLETWDRDLGKYHRGRSAKKESAGKAMSGGTGIPVGELSRELLNRTWTRVAKRGRTIEAASPAEALHDLRKRCKELRYLLEFFGSLYDQRTLRRIVDELKLLQDNLGEFQDAESQRLLVRSSAEEMRAAGAPIGTLLAMGALEHQLMLRQAAAHDDCAACWSRFDDPETRAQFKDMVSA